MSLKKLYNDICIEIADRWHIEYQSAVNLTYYAKIFGTSETAMKGILLRNPDMIEILPDWWTSKKYIKI